MIKSSTILNRRLEEAGSKAGAVLRHQGEEVPHEEASQAVMKAKSNEEREIGEKCQ